MKKNLTLLVILLGIYSVSCAQTKTKSEFGFNIGFNTSATLDVLSTSTNGIGFNAGVSGDYYFSNRWSIKAKLSYDQKGWTQGVGLFGEPDGFETGHLTLNYLTVPLMANWHFGKTRNWFLDVGPYAGFLMNASLNNADIKPRFKSTDFGFAFGIGVKFPIAEKAKLFLEYDAQTSLTNIFNSSDFAYINLRAAFNVGVSFPIY